MKSRGFTLIELLVVIAIIGILSAVILPSLLSSRTKARDTERLADLQEVQKAIELYASDHYGTYPSTNGNWWGNCSGFGSHGTTGSNAWVGDVNGGIVAPGYIAVLPVDPAQTNGHCYTYKSNGTDYMLRAYQTVEYYTQATNRWAEPIDNGVGSNPYQNTFAFYTAGAAGW